MNTTQRVARRKLTNRMAPTSGGSSLSADPLGHFANVHPTIIHVAVLSVAATNLMDYLHLLDRQTHDLLTVMMGRFEQ